MNIIKFFHAGIKVKVKVDNEFLEEIKMTNTV